MRNVYCNCAKSRAVRISVSFLVVFTFLKLIQSGMYKDDAQIRWSRTTGSDPLICDLPWWDGAINNCTLVMQTFLGQNNTTRSYCGKRADVVGEGQKVISYCLYGDFNRYAVGLPQILRNIQSLYPGWIVRLYTEPQKYTKGLLPLLRQHENLHVCDVTNLPGDISDWREGNSMLWRAAVMGDELVDVFLSRDIDAVILEREVAAVKEFLESGKSLHTMRDHPGQKATMMGGMYGVRQTPSNRPLLNSIRRQIFDGRTNRLNDQQLFENHLYSSLKDDKITHDSYLCENYENVRPFPTQRQNYTFIGNRMYRMDHPNDRNKMACPLECRPINHPDWEFC